MKIIQVNVNGFDNNFSYIIMSNNNDSLLIDPTGDKKILDDAIKKNNVVIKMILITHSHPDHTELLDYFLKKNVCVKKFCDLKKNPIFFMNEIKIKTIFTPGHTKDSVCFLIKNNIFTGDTLFVKGLGTTSFGGNRLDQKKSIELLQGLDKKIIVWPGHDYNGSKTSLGKALFFVSEKPSDKIFEEIKKKVLDYEKK
jgi:hydroxyacylglutathione hydrolase